MKITLAQISPKLGDIDGNKQLVLDAISKSVSDIIVCPELCLVGYPPTDALNEPGIESEIASAISMIVASTQNQLVIFGAPVFENERWYNSAICASNGQIIHRYDKQLLPNYDIFNESRYFSRGETQPWFVWNDQVVGIVICEDIWFESGRSYDSNPCDAFAEVNLDILVHIAASPFEKDKYIERHELLMQLHHLVDCDVVSVNQVGVYSDIIFDGHSMVLANNQVQLLPKFEVAIEHVTTDQVQCMSEDMDEMEIIQGAIEFGLKEYLSRSGMSSCVVGVSGGIDSALVAALAVQAIGAENVKLVSLPTQYNSPETKSDARLLADHLDCQLSEYSIETLRKEMDGSLQEINGDKLSDVTEQNIQARLRGMILMGLANQNNGLLLTTGNKSELAMGYATLYGDMCGGLNLIGDLFKTEVVALARYLNKDREWIPKRIIERPPTAELRHDQLDSDTLPEYDKLDRVLTQRMIENMPLSQIRKLNDNINVDNIMERLQRNEFKRWQSPPVLKISSKSFGRGWQFPIVT